MILLCLTPDKFTRQLRKQNLRIPAVVGYGVKIFLPSPPNYITRSPGIASLVC